MKEGWKANLQHSDAILAIGVIGLVLLLVIPLPPLILDALLCLNIAFSVMALLLTLYVENALEFSAFPTMLLFLTLYRLGLNIASTRMILTRAEGGDIIHTFGNFVTQGHVTVGLVLFALLTIINFVVVTKGAGRVAEVAARFTLEALSGKQMSIDGEMSAGMLTGEEAKERRKKVTEEAEFYGAMDGASKFVRGDAVAGLIITCVNILGGFFVGLLVKKYSLVECWNLYARLTVGDGLVSQIPALLVSIGAGVMVTRASSGSVGKMLFRQIFNYPKVFLITAITLLCLSVVPGMPLFIIVPIAVTLLGYSLYLFKEEKRPELPQKSKPLELRLGVKVVSHAENLKGELTRIRKSVESSLGITLPPIQITDSAALLPNHFAVVVGGDIASEERAGEFEQIVVRVEKLIAKRAFELLTRHDVAQMLEKVKRFDRSLSLDLKLSLGQMLKILQNLLKEEISIRDFTSIVEILAESEEEDLDLLTQKVREGMARKITRQYFGETKTAYVITLDPKVEQMIQAAMTFSSQERLRPKTVENIAKQLHELSAQVLKNGHQPVVLTESKARYRLKQLIEKELPDLPVLSYGEVTSDVKVHSVGMIKTDVLI